MKKQRGIDVIKKFKKKNDENMHLLRKRCLFGGSKISWYENWDKSSFKKFSYLLIQILILALLINNPDFWTMRRLWLLGLDNIFQMFLNY